MPDNFKEIFTILKELLAPYEGHLAVKTDTPEEYWLVTRGPSPFPQHKGHPLDVTWIRTGKAYVSFHLMPIYMKPELTKAMSPALKKRMQGKTCFNFTSRPDAEMLEELSRLTWASLSAWTVPARSS